MTNPASRLVRSPLAGTTLDLGPDADYVIAEWRDDGRHPDELIAPPHIHLEGRCTMGPTETTRRSRPCSVPTR